MTSADEVVQVRKGTDDLQPSANMEVDVSEMPLTAAELAAKAAEAERQSVLFEKILFTIGVINVMLMCMFVGIYPSFIPWFYTMKFFFCVGLRVYVYRAKQWHYFCIELCYWVNAFLLVYLWLMPQEEYLFGVLYALTHGPLLWAIILFNNSVVFHDIHKITSVLIHFTPCVTMYTIKCWMTGPIFSISGLGERIPFPAELTYTQTLFWPMVFVVLHQILYWLIFQVLLGDYIRNVKGLTSYIYLVEVRSKKNNGFLWQFCNLLGPQDNRKVFMFGVFLCAYSFVTMIPVHLYYNNCWVNFGVLFVACVIAVWNGAEFYANNYIGKGYGTTPKSLKKLKARVEELEAMMIPEAL